MIPKSFSQENRPSCNWHDLELGAGQQWHVAYYKEGEAQAAYDHADRLERESNAQHPEYDFHASVTPLSRDADIIAGGWHRGETIYEVRISWHKKDPIFKDGVVEAENTWGRMQEGTVLDWRWRNAHGIRTYGP